MSPTKILFCPIGEARHLDALRQTVSATSRSEVTAIDLLAVVPSASSWDRLAHADHVTDVVSKTTSNWRARFERWSETFEAVNSFETTEGHVADAITQHALDIGTELIVLSAGHDSHDLATVRRIMRTSECPVWVVRPTRAHKQRVLAAVNPEPAELDLNLAIISEASRLTTQVRGELSLITAWKLYGEETLRRSAFVQKPIEDSHELYDLRERVSTQGLTELAQAADLKTEPSLIVKNGIAAPTILETLKKGRFTQLVIGTVGRAGLSGLLMGNTAEHLLGSVSCSVYAVKPPGFLSPLR